MTAGMWDFWSYGGPVEWIVVALSAYELMSVCSRSQYPEAPPA